MIREIFSYLPYDVKFTIVKELCEMFPNKVRGKVTDTINYIPCEIEYYIFGLDAGFWAYGSFEPNCPLFILDKEEERNRLGIVI